MDPLATCWAWHPSVPSRLEQSVGLLRLEGPDALRVLHGQSSQAIELAGPGAVLATCLISPTARMRALALVLVDAQGAWLLIEAGDGAAVRMALERVLFPADRVELGPLQEALLITPVPGPLPGELPRCEPGHWQPLVNRANAWIVGERLVLLDAAAQASTPALPASLAERPRLNLQEQERWRLQHGIPAAPGELNDEHNPFELGLAERVSLSKGCYVGQETLAKLATYDGVKQQLRRWCWLHPQGNSAQPPQAGQTLVSGSGERAGQISSALALPQADGTVLWLGLALVRRSALDQSTLLLGDQGPELLISLPESFAAPPVRS